MVRFGTAVLVQPFWCRFCGGADLFDIKRFSVTLVISTSLSLIFSYCVCVSVYAFMRMIILNTYVFVIYISLFFLPLSLSLSHSSSLYLYISAHICMWVYFSLVLKSTDLKTSCMSSQPRQIISVKNSHIYLPLSEWLFANISASCMSLYKNNGHSWNNKHCLDQKNLNLYYNFTMEESNTERIETYIHYIRNNN